MAINYADKVVDGGATPAGQWRPQDANEVKSTVNALEGALDALESSIDALGASLNATAGNLAAKADQASTARMFNDVLDLFGTPAAQLPPGLTAITRREGYIYAVAPTGATDHDVLGPGGAKFYAWPINGLYLTPEQLGYRDFLANWGEVAQRAWDRGYVLSLGPRTYLTSTTAYVRPRTGVVGVGDRVSVVRVADGSAINVIDTANYAARRANNSPAIESPGNPLGVLTGVVLKDFAIDGARGDDPGPGAVPEGTANSGIGVRLYARMMAISNLRIVGCAAHGLETCGGQGTPSPFVALNDARAGFVEGLTIMNCGYEGWIFRGPADIPVSRPFIGNNGRAKTGVYDALNRTTSLVFPGETVDGLVLDNMGAEFANGHCWNQQHGRGIRIRTDASGVRARFFNMISEGNWGQVHIDSGARVEFYGEIHGNDGGPRNERVFYDAVNVAGSPFAVGQTLTGVTSGATGTITSVEERTPTSGLIIVSFASDAERERRFADNERVTNGTRQVTVYRPDYYGAVPWWRDDSMQGNLVSLKVFQTGLNDGGTMLRIGGQNHVYTVQAQSSTPRFGHGIDLYGDNVTINGYMEGRARTAPNGQASAGLIVRAGAERANINLTVRSCQQNVLFEDPGLGSRFDITSVDPIGDHMNGLETLSPAAIGRGRLMAIAGGATVWERRPAEASLADVRGGVGNDWISPAMEATASLEMDRGAVSGNVEFNPAAGRNQFFQISGDTKFVPASTLIPTTGTIRVRLEGPYAVRWDRRFVRDDAIADLTPDDLPWRVTVYSYTVIDGRIHIVSMMSVPDVVAAPPALDAFGAAYDPAATGLALVGATGSVAAGVGDPVTRLQPVGSNRNYLLSDGSTASITVSQATLSTGATAGLPVLADVDGRLGLQHSAGGSGLTAQLFGLQNIGMPNPSTNALAMPFQTTLTWAGMVYLPPGSTAGAIASVFRGENASTAQLALIADAAARVSGMARMASGSVRQIGSAADVAASLALREAEVDAEAGRWIHMAFQVRISSVDPAASTEPQGGVFEMWLDDGQAGHEVVPLGTWRGDNNVAWRPNRLASGALGSSSALQQQRAVVVGRQVALLGTLERGSPAWWRWMHWVGAS